MKETTNSAVTAIQRIGTGLIMILVPAFLIVGFSAHPNLGNLSPLKSAADWVSEFRHNAIWGHAHMGVLFITPLFIPIIMGLKRLSERKAPWHALIGSSLAILGVALLAMDKGAVYMVPSAMESLSDQQFVQAMPVIEALFNKEGPLSLLYLLPSLFIGMVILGIGLLKNPAISRWKSAAVVIAFLLMLNPDIDLISAIASVVMLVGLGSIGLDITRGKLGNE